jgi:hypothetical protein
MGLRTILQFHINFQPVAAVSEISISFLASALEEYYMTQTDFFKALYSDSMTVQANIRSASRKHRKEAQLLSV